MKILTALFLTVVMSIQGCGYSTKSGLAPQWRTIYIAPVVNQVDFTSPYNNNLYTPLLEVKLREGVSEGFLRDGYLKIVNTADEADMMLNIFLQYYRHNPLRYDDGDNVIEWRVSVAANIELWDNRLQELVWSGGVGGSKDTFRSGPRAVSEDEAINDAVDDLGRRIVEQVIERW